MIDKTFWSDKKVFITGHTGFKGAWLSLWLHALGAKVTGYALEPPTSPNLFQLARVDQFLHSMAGDVRSGDELGQAILDARPDIVFHMAAQPLVRYAYEQPSETFQTNVMGTVHLLEAVRTASEQGVPIRVVINVTTDKCYENREWVWGYREQDRLGGRDPYSSSKACAELVTACYRDAFFQPAGNGAKAVAVATVRAGNVIGGGDWARDRLLPDCIRSLLGGQPIKLRNPDAIRPWQHVLEPLSGYLLLAERMWEQPARFSQSYNFGPEEGEARSVAWIVRRLCEKWGEDAAVEREPQLQAQWHEARWLKLDCARAKAELDWRPAWTIEQTLDKIVEWTRGYQAGEDVRKLCRRQIDQYMAER